ncbi:hypothetical protein AK812_SmicGene17787 [Symbiodinium microadriaticum]|uniref:Uncharacterized protein n=1 Tax=Symbiodinium microadriaticum TaxID=2951 RepID=A0A1Q9DWR7_SYMMI|nr:hypothetical protein AK812_SmicGene17787 [Symbiodinium microadriaticum]
MPASAGTVCASSCLAFVVCIMNYASMDADFIDQSLRPDLIRLIQCIMTMQKLTMWEEQAKFLCELRGIMSVCVASWDNAKAMFSLPATYPPLADYAWPRLEKLACLITDKMCIVHMHIHLQNIRELTPEEQSKLTDIVMGNFTDPFLVILDEDEEDETSLLDKAVEANMEFLKVQHVVAKAKRTLESNNPVMYELKQLCGPKLLEKRKSNPKKPVEPEGGFIAQFSASRRLKLHTSTLHAGPDDAAQPVRIDTQSTLAMDLQGLPAPPAAPKFLEAVLSDIESRPSTCFDHAKQYKKQFRELIKQGQGAYFIDSSAHDCHLVPSQPPPPSMDAADATVPAAKAKAAHPGPSETPMLMAYRLFCGAARRDGFSIQQASQLWKHSAIRETFVEECTEAQKKKRLHRFDQGFLYVDLMMASADVLEMFAGQAAITAEARSRGQTAIKLDINMGNEADINTSAGFMLHLAAVLCLRAGGLLVLAPPCSSYSWMCRFATGRRWLLQEGLPHAKTVEANITTSRNSDGRDVICSRCAKSVEPLFAECSSEEEEESMVPTWDRAILESVQLTAEQRRRVDNRLRLD